MSDGSFVLTPGKLLNCYAVGYNHIGDFIQNLSKNVTPNKKSDNCNLKNEDVQEKMHATYDIKLLLGASIVNEIREAVKKETGKRMREFSMCAFSVEVAYTKFFTLGFECSAGIAHNKILAKLVCGMNKPNKQTVLPVKNVPQLFRYFVVVVHTYVLIQFFLSIAPCQ